MKDNILEITDSFEISILINAPRNQVFNDWLDSDAHSAFTGEKAVISPNENGRFTAWDGYISGTTELIKEHTHILQRWRTSDFSDDDPDSLLEIRFEDANMATKITLVHSIIPKGQGKDYEVGWIQYYFEPMQNYYQCIE